MQMLLTNFRGDTMGIKALLTYNYGNEKMKELEKLGYEIMFVDEKEVVYSQELSEVEVLIGYDPFKTLDITKMKKLKWIQVSSVGIDQLPIEMVKEAKIIVSNNRGGYSIPMGEWIVLKILEMLKNSSKFFDNQKKKLWKYDKSLLELYGKTVGFLGTGTIAKNAAKRLKGFDVNIFGSNTSGKDVEYFDRCFSSAQMDEMLNLSDIVVVTIPYTEDTYHMINNEMICKMKDGVYFINVARGAIADEDALIKNLRNGKMMGAALDVFENEPLPEDSPLWDMDNVIITPHNSWISEKKDDRRYEIIYENMKNYIEGKEMRNVIDLNKGY